MYPRLAEFFGQPLPAYFTLLVVGFGLATLIGVRLSKRISADHEVFIDLGLFSLIAGVLGGRALHVIADGYFWDYVHLCTDPSLVEWRITQAQCSNVEGVWDAAASVCKPAGRDCFAWAAFWRGGLAYYGGLIAASAYGIHFLRKEGFPVLKGVDFAAIGIALGLFFGRMGCFLGGCCFGSQLDEGHFAAVRFPAWSPASESQWREGLLSHPGLESLPVHPAQLYEALGCLAITAFVVAWRPRKRFDGQLMMIFLALYAALRFVLEYVRADDRGGMLGLSTSQLIGVAIMAVVVFGYVKLSAHAKSNLADA